VGAFAVASSGPASQPHGLRGYRTQNIENNPMQSRMAAATYAIPRRHFDTSGKSPAIIHHQIQMIDDATTDRDLRSPPSNHFREAAGPSRWLPLDPRQQAMAAGVSLGQRSG
jgi:hypothetical protein